MADAAGIAPDPPLDGRSLVSTERRAKVLTEGWTGRGAWASIRAEEYQYVEYYDHAGELRFREYYDLERDPWQLLNLLGDPRVRNDPYTDALAIELAEARTCAGPGCSAILDRPATPTACGSGRARGHQLVGSLERDRIRGTRVRDVACGRRGNDRLAGRKGNDVLIGGPGRDVCHGGPGRDRYRGCEVRT
jgi:hypothetical protein